MCNHPMETWALYNIKKAQITWMESWTTDQLLAQGVCKESLNGDIDISDTILFGFELLNFFFFFL